MGHTTPMAAWRSALAALLVTTSCLAHAQDAAQPLTGTLARVRQTGSITLGYREASVPFSFLTARGEPVGYSIDLCKQLVDAIGEQLGRSVAIQWQPVTAQSRIPALLAGQIDLECGSTTNNLERGRQVAFSPTIFVSGTRLLVRRGSPIHSYRDLGGRKVVVTAGTTNEKALRELSRRFGLAVEISVAVDHAASYAQLAAGTVDAFATDDVLLAGLVAQNKAQAEYTVVGDFLSYDPYGLMYRKGDPAMSRLVEDTFRQLAQDREIERRYERWFLQRLPSGVSLDLPMSPQLETLIQALAAPAE